MKSARRWLVGLSHRVACATLIGIYTWLFSYLPYSATPRLLGDLAYIFDFPVAAASLVLPFPFKGIDLFFGRGVGEFMSKETLLFWHLRVAIPVYVLLFYVPNLIKGGFGLIRKRKVRSEGVTAASPESARRATT
jgi:hypothetical protein